MNWDVIQGNWKQAVGKVKEQWGKLSDDDLVDRRDAHLGVEHLGGQVDGAALRCRA